MMKLYRIESSYFTAGAVFERGLCVRAAPIIRWMIGREYGRLYNICISKGWQIKEVKK